MYIDIYAYYPFFSISVRKK